MFVNWAFLPEIEELLTQVIPVREILNDIAFFFFFFYTFDS